MPDSPLLKDDLSDAESEDSDASSDDWCRNKLCKNGFKRPPAGAAARRFFEFFEKISFFEKLVKIGFVNHVWADLDSKFGFSVKNRSYSWAQIIISSFFEIRLFF